MKKLLLIAVVMVGTSVGAYAQDFVAPVPVPPRVQDPLHTVEPGEGAINRAVRMGNPAQLINPLAPAVYGSGAAVVYYEEGDPFQRPPHRRNARPLGVRLLSIAW